jgi:hypothetical protein
MDDYLVALYKKRLIDKEVVLENAHDKEAVTKEIF